MKVIVVKQLVKSETDFSKQNRCIIIEFEVGSDSKCTFEMPEINDVIELTISKLIKHLRVFKIEKREDPVVVFVEEIIESGEVEKNLS